MTQQTPNFAQSLIGGTQQGQETAFNRQFKPLQLQEAQMRVGALESQQNIDNTIQGLTQLEGEIGSGMSEGQILQNLQTRRNEILQRGGNPADTDEAIQAISTGGMPQLQQLLQSGRTAFERSGLLAPISGPGLSEEDKIRLEGDQKIRLEKIKQEATAGTDAMKIADDLRGEIVNVAKESGFSKVLPAYDRISASAKDPSAAGDLSLIFNYMKMLDPGSVVRESEFATAENAASVPERVRNVFNKILSGEKLAPEQRKDFVNRANQLFSAAKSRFEKQTQPLLNIGKSRNLTKDQILGEGFFESFAAEQIEEPATQPAQPAPAPVQISPQVQGLTDEQLLQALQGQ